MTTQHVTHTQTQNATATPGRYKPVFALIGTFLLAAFVALGGAMKLAGASTEMLAGLGVPAWAVPVIGVLELAAGIGLMVPRLRFLAAVGLTGIMLGAVGTHLVNGDLVGWSVPFIIGALTATIAWHARPQHLRG